MGFRKIIHSVKGCVCSVIFWTAAIRTLGLVLLYYAFSITLTFYQKWFIEGFSYPLFTVLCHMIIKFILAAITRALVEYFSRRKRVTIEWHVYIRKLCSTGIASALDIGLSNWSFEFITISLYTMSKSSCIIFILGFSLLFGLEKLKCSLVIVVMLIATGLFLFTFQSTQFSLIGFILVILAALSGGLRWTLAQLVMQKKELGLSNPIDMIYHIQPWMILGILPMAIAFEGVELCAAREVFRFEDTDLLFRTSSLILVGSFIAYTMEISEYLLLTYTSSLTLSVAGIVKEVCTLYLAAQFNGDQMTTINVIGLGISLVGISIHIAIKAIQTQGPELRRNTSNIANLLDEGLTPLLVESVDSECLDNEIVSYSRLRQVTK